MLLEWLARATALHVASTPAEREAIYRFRYSIYGDELKRDYPGLDRGAGALDGEAEPARPLAPAGDDLGRLPALMRDNVGAALDRMKLANRPISFLGCGRGSRQSTTGAGMKRIEWTESLRIGQLAIDEQHRRLFQLIDSVPDTAARYDGRLLHELLDYVVRHFDAEEAFMNRICYPLLAEHVILHRALKQSLLTHKANFDAGSLNARDFKEFVVRWLTEHILREDKKIGRFFAAMKTTPGR